MNKTLLASLTLLLTACGSGKFTTSNNPDPVSNDLTGTTCDADNTDPVECSGENDCTGVQFCEAGEWGMCDCSEEFIGGSGGSNNPSGGANTGGETQETGGSSGATGGNDSPGGSGGTSCVPKTCDEYSVEQTGSPGNACGMLDDGCGGEILCANNLCDSTEPDYECGESILNSEWYSPFLNPENFSEEMLGNQNNICYGGIIRIDYEDNRRQWCQYENGTVGLLYAALSRKIGSSDEELVNKVQEIHGPARECSLVSEFVVCC